MGEITRTAGLQAECVLLIIVASIATLLRVVSRTQSKAGLWWDDYLSLLSLVCKEHKPLKREQLSFQSSQGCCE